jgi:hypothetical protein
MLHKPNFTAGWPAWTSAQEGMDSSCTLTLVLFFLFGCLFFTL